MKRRGNRGKPENERGNTDPSPEVIKRLLGRGIEYTFVRKIVSEGINQQDALFLRLLEGKSIRSIQKELKFLNSVRTTLARLRGWLGEKTVEPLARETEGLREYVEFLLWCAFQIEIGRHSNPAGERHCRSYYLPTGHDEGGSPLFIYPTLRYEVRDKSNRLIKTYDLPHELSLRKKNEIAAKVLAALARGSGAETKRLGRALTRKGSVIAWPPVSRWVIPRLYELLIPYYQDRPGYAMGTRETVAPRLKYPRQLFEDMVDVLRLELGLFSPTLSRPLPVGGEMGLRPSRMRLLNESYRRRKLKGRFSAYSLFPA